MDVVSEDAASRARDYEDKRRDYAQAGIPEYWIVDPAEPKILVLSLEGDRYHVAHEAGVEAHAASRVLPGFEVSVEAVIMQTHP
jgi:Uma2 family endonuclease